MPVNNLKLLSIFKGLNYCRYPVWNVVIVPAQVRADYFSYLYKIKNDIK